MATMTMSKIALAVRRSADGEQCHDGALCGQALSRVPEADHCDTMLKRRSSGGARQCI